MVTCFPVILWRVLVREKQLIPEHLDVSTTGNTEKSGQGSVAWKGDQNQHIDNVESSIGQVNKQNEMEVGGGMDVAVLIFWDG